MGLAFGYKAFNAQLRENHALTNSGQVTGVLATMVWGERGVDFKGPVIDWVTPEDSVIIQQIESLLGLEINAASEHGFIGTQ
jgi:hypothetical protein